MNMLWMVLLGMDWAELSSADLTTPRVLVQEEVLDYDEIQSRLQLAERRMRVAATMGDDIHACAPTRSRVAVPNHLGPSSWEVDQWSATRLTPDDWPYEVERLDYYLGHETKRGYQLDATLEHTVTLYASTSDTPPATGTPIAQITHGLDSAIDGYNYISWTLDTPVVLGEGEHLYVVIQHVGPWPDALSVLVCPAVTDPGGWWSNAVSQPYDWEPLVNFGIPDTPMIWAYGYELF